MWISFSFKTLSLIIAVIIFSHCCRFEWFLKGFFLFVFVNKHIKYLNNILWTSCLTSWANKLLLHTCAQPQKTSAVTWCAVGPYAGSHNKHCTFALRASPSEVLQKCGIMPAVVGSGERKKKQCSFFLCETDHWDLDSRFPNKLSACCKKKQSVSCSCCMLLLAVFLLLTKKSLFSSLTCFGRPQFSVCMSLPWFWIWEFRVKTTWNISIKTPKGSDFRWSLPLITCAYSSEKLEATDPPLRHNCSESFVF